MWVIPWACLFFKEHRPDLLHRMLPEFDGTLPSPNQSQAEFHTNMLSISTKALHLRKIHDMPDCPYLGCKDATLPLPLLLPAHAHSCMAIFQVSDGADGVQPALP